jgi:hypothetical protein
MLAFAFPGTVKKNSSLSSSPWVGSSHESMMRTSIPAGSPRLLPHAPIPITDWVTKTEGRSRWQFSQEVGRRGGRKNTRTVEHEGKFSLVVEHERPQVLSLNAPVGSDTDSELGEAVAALVVDASTGRDEALGRALRSRDSEAGRPSEDL